MGEQTEMLRLFFETMGRRAATCSQLAVDLDEKLRPDGFEVRWDPDTMCIMIDDPSTKASAKIRSNEVGARRYYMFDRALIRLKERRGMVGAATS